MYDDTTTFTMGHRFLAVGGRSQPAADRRMLVPLPPEKTLGPVIKVIFLQHGAVGAHRLADPIAELKK